ncbi:MAG: hypothetical protein HQK59_01210 [Deltaproteobacteria bacterium]|nr:hypothetical protein [Deltaproteobacteria bacterium]
MATKEEQMWFRRFYEGTILIKGWKHRMNEILQVIPQADRDEMKEFLEKLGDKLGWEWAKDKKITRIDNALLLKWGEDLKHAKNKGPAAIVAEVYRLDAEVDDILSKT